MTSEQHSLPGSAEADFTQTAAEQPEATAQTRHARLLSQLKSIIHQLSGLPLDRIDEHATFLELGFDSLFLTQANAAFKKAFKLRLTTRQLIETTPVLDALAAYIDSNLPADAILTDAAAPVLATSTAAPTGAAPVQTGDSPGRPTIKKATITDLTPEQEQHIDALIATTTARTPSAKMAAQASRHVLADPRTVQGFRSRWKEMVYPVLSDRAKGSKIWDVDGNEYIDLVCGYGVTFLGHNPDFIVKAVRDQIDRTLAIGPQTVLAAEVAQMVSEMTGMERVAFCNTGSEAVLAAVRMARTVTGKSKVAKFDGHYHGIFDEMQVRGTGKGSRLTALPSAPGIPAEAIQNTMILKYGDPDAFNVIRENADDLALVLVEPVRSRNPDFQPREYLHELRRVTEELGIPLLFDEMVTGFRSHPGGAQAIFGVRADMATYGKVAGGGLPIGIVTGSALFMDTLDGGMWQFGDDSVPTSDMTWFAGTFVRHPLALASTRATLAHLKSEGPALQERLNARSAALATRLNTFLQRMQAPIKVEQFSSVLRVTFTEHQEYADLLFFHLRNRGILTYEGRPIFLTTAHSDQDLNAVHDAFVESVTALIHVGLLDGRDPTAVRRIAMATGQQEIWISAQFSPEASCSYNLCSTLTLAGQMDLAVLQAALNDLVARHEALRAVPERDGLMQTIRAELLLTLAVDDLRQLGDASREARIDTAKRAEVTTPFDLQNGPLVRARALQLADNQHLVLLTVHHVIADGWSCGVLLRELGELYAARRAGRAPSLPVAQQLSDFVAFHQHPDQLVSRAEARDYWMKLYDGALPRVEFPSDRPRPKIRDYSAKRIELPLDPAVVASLRRAALENGTTLFASLIGGFAAYLTRLTGISSNPIGFSAAGQPLMGGTGLVGHCVNFLPLRLTADTSQGFASHLKGIGAAVLDALEYQNFDFVSFVQEVHPQRDADWAPLVTIGVNLDPSSKGVNFDDFRVQAGSVGRAFENLDLFLNFVETNADVELQCTFNSAMHDEVSIRRRMQEYLNLLAAAATKPQTPLDNLNFIETRDQTALVHTFNDTARPYPRDASLAELFRQTAQTHADKTALRDAAAAEISYRDLDRLSDDMAARLAAVGVGQGDFVALLLSRSIEMIVGILATLKSGAAYVPIDPALPDTRRDFILRDSGASAVLTTGAIADATACTSQVVIAMDRPGEGAAPASAPTAPTGGADPAYMMYTSGSTGVPKGVLVPHRAVARLVLGSDFARLDDSRVIAQLAPPSFDASTFEIWAALLHGGTLVVVPGDQPPALAELGQVLSSTGVTTLWLTAALFNAIIDENPSILSGVSEILTGGEALSVAHVRRALAALPETTLINGYGPTENTTFTCCYRIPRDIDPREHSIPIGRPIANTQVYLVDDALRLVPIGVPGELLVGGDGLALSYWNRPDLTETAFVPDTLSDRPDAATRQLYRTGDICRYLPDGSIDFLGRKDNQVKIRGYRIELGEVEAALQDIPGVRKAAVVHEAVHDSSRLIAFVEVSGETLTSARITRALRDKLPRHLIPSRTHLMLHLPISANGKVDRRELLRLSSGLVEEIRATAPATTTEAQLAAIWADLLQRPILSVDESFFALGGHSLMAVRLFDRVRRQFGPDLPISTLFACPTIRDLSECIENNQATARSMTSDPDADWDTTTVIHPGPETAARPLFIVGGMGGNVNNLIELGRCLGAHRAVIGFQTRGVMGHNPRATIEEMAAEHIRYMRRHQAFGPYLIAGYSAGAHTAYEIARQLTALGQQVAELVLLDTYAPGFTATFGSNDPFAFPFKQTLPERLRTELTLVGNHGVGQLADRLRRRVEKLVRAATDQARTAEMAVPLVRGNISSQALRAAAKVYKGGNYSGTACLVLSKPNGWREELIVSQYPTLGWDKLIDPGKIRYHASPVGHLAMVEGANAAELARQIEAWLTTAGTRV